MSESPSELMPESPSSSGPVTGGRRRVDRVLAPDFLDGLGELPLDEVRELRHEAEQEEVDLSYVRRMLQGRSDIVRAELARRSGDNDENRAVVDHLTDVLADGPRSDHGLGRHLTVEPSRVDEHRRTVEAVIADTGLSDVSARTEEELRAALDKLGEVEHGVSETRALVQVVMDALTTEVGRRYTSGTVDLDQVLNRTESG